MALVRFEQISLSNRGVARHVWLRVALGEPVSKPVGAGKGVGLGASISLGASVGLGVRVGLDEGRGAGRRIGEGLGGPIGEGAAGASDRVPAGLGSLKASKGRPVTPVGPPNAHPAMLSAPAA